MLANKLLPVTNAGGGGGGYNDVGIAHIATLEYTGAPTSYNSGQQYYYTFTDVDIGTPYDNRYFLAVAVSQDETSSSNNIGLIAVGDIVLSSIETNGPVHRGFSLLPDTTNTTATVTVGAFSMSGIQVDLYALYIPEGYVVSWREDNTNSTLAPSYPVSATFGTDLYQDCFVVAVGTAFDGNQGIRKSTVSWANVSVGSTPYDIFTGSSSFLSTLEIVYANTDLETNKLTTDTTVYSASATSYGRTNTIIAFCPLAAEDVGDTYITGTATGFVPALAVGDGYGTIDLPEAAAAGEIAVVHSICTTTDGITAEIGDGSSFRSLDAVTASTNDIVFYGVITATDTQVRLTRTANTIPRPFVCFSYSATSFGGVTTSANFYSSFILDALANGNALTSVTDQTEYRLSSTLTARSATTSFEVYGYGGHHGNVFQNIPMMTDYLSQRAFALLWEKPAFSNFTKHIQNIYAVGVADVYPRFPNTDYTIDISISTSPFPVTGVSATANVGTVTVVVPTIDSQLVDYGTLADTGTITFPTVSENCVAIIGVSSDASNARVTPTGWTRYDNDNQGLIFGRVYTGSISDVSLSDITGRTTDSACVWAVFTTSNTIPFDDANNLQDSGGMPDPPNIVGGPENGDAVLLWGGLDDDAVASSVTAPATYTMCGVIESTTGGPATTAMMAYAIYKANNPGATDNPPDAFGGSGSDRWYAGTFLFKHP